MNWLGGTEWPETSKKWRNFLGPDIEKQAPSLYHDNPQE